MSETIDPTLQELLDMERDCCARLLPILDAERTAAAAYDPLAVLACLRERETLQAQWQRVALQRRRRTGPDGLSSVRAGDPGIAATVEATRRLAAQVRRAQRVNEGLIRAALAHVTDLLTVMRRERRDSVYDGRATLNTPRRAFAGGSWSA